MKVNMLAQQLNLQPHDLSRHIEKLTAVFPVLTRSTFLRYELSVLVDLLQNVDALPQRLVRSGTHRKPLWIQSGISAMAHCRCYYVMHLLERNYYRTRKA